MESGKSILGRVEMEENEHDFIHTLVAEVVTTQMRWNYKKRKNIISPCFQNIKFLLLFTILYLNI